MNQLQRLLLLFAFMVSVFFSCKEAIDGPSRDADYVEKIVVRSGVQLSLSTRDTVSVDVTISPSLVDMDMVKQHRIYLLKKDGTEPSAYKIVDIERLINGESDSYRFFIADTDGGCGYKDRVQICYRNTNTFVVSNPFIVENAGTTLFTFSLSDGRTVWDSFETKNDTIMVQVPNSFNLKAATAIFTHNGAGVYSNGVVQFSGEGMQDFSDFCNPLEYSVKDFEGEEQKYTIEVFNLPIIYVNTPDSVDITSRYEWLGNSSFIIRDTNGIIEDYGEAYVKGRGNWTWKYGLESGKKPYTIKLAKKPKDKTVLGMPGHKRWVLLANPVSFLPNPVGFEVNRRAETCKWAPRSRFVELFLNGKHQGLYLLCEQIRIDKNRVDIKEMKETDIEDEAVTGGYLITYDDAVEDDDPSYRSQSYNFPFIIKNPDADEIKPEQLTYITDYINAAELSLYDDDMFTKGCFMNYFDIDSWIDYYFVAELWGALELQRPRSVWLYKDRGGKLTAGPVWDYESNFFHEQHLYCKSAFYYGRMLQNSSVIERLKNKWPQFRSNILGNENYSNIVEAIDSLYNECHFAAERDRILKKSSPPAKIPYSDGGIDPEYRVIRDNILVKLEWLEKQIMSW